MDIKLVGVEEENMVILKAFMVGQIVLIDV